MRGKWARKAAGAMCESGSPPGGRGVFRAACPPPRSPVRPHPACRSFIPFRSTPFPLSPPGAAGPLFARNARPRARVSAPARFARLIARARPRARTGRRTHLACRLNRGLFAPVPTRRDTASGCRVHPPYLGVDRSGIKLFIRNISDYENNLRVACRKGPCHRLHLRETGRPGVLSREMKAAHSSSVSAARPSRSTGR